MLPSGSRSGVIVARMLLKHKALGRNQPFHFFRELLGVVVIY